MSQLQAETGSSSQEPNLSIVDDVSEVDPNVFVASNGLKLRLKPVSRLLVVEAGRKVVRPKPPRMWIEEKQREDENPNDPDYQAELQDAEFRRGMTAIDVCLALGTEIEYRPPELEEPQSEGWAEDIEAFGALEIPKKPRGRYLAWLKYYALNDDDLTKAIQAVMRVGGLTTEEDVDKAMEGFRRNQKR